MLGARHTTDHSSRSALFIRAARRGCRIVPLCLVRGLLTLPVVLPNVFLSTGLAIQPIRPDFPSHVSRFPVPLPLLPIHDSMLFGRRVPEQVATYQEVLFDQAMSYLKPISGEEVILEMVCPCKWMRNWAWPGWPVHIPCRSPRQKGLLDEQQKPRCCAVRS